MNIHEYQAKELLKGYNVPTVPGFLALSPDEAINAAEKIGGDVSVSYTHLTLPTTPYV